VTKREERLIKLQQLRGANYFLADSVRYTHTHLNLSIGPSTVSRILRDYNMYSARSQMQWNRGLILHHVSSPRTSNLL
jgi:hypothetical protein